MVKQKIEDEVKKFIKEIRKFYSMNLDYEQVRPLLQLAVARSYSKGEVILGIGEPRQKIYLIVKGIARMYYLDLKGKDVTKSFLPEYSLCGTESFFTDEGIVLGMEALENLRLYEFPAKQVKEYILKNDVLKEVYIQFLERAVLYKIHRESSFQLKSATQRYIEFKLEYIEQHSGSLKLPAYFFEGRYDYQVSSKAAVKEIEKIPSTTTKEIIWFEESGHPVNDDESEKFHDIMVNTVLKQTYH